MPLPKLDSLTRRRLLKGLGLSPLLLRPLPIAGSSILLAPPAELPHPASAFPFSDLRLQPHYPVRSPLEDVLRLLAPGSDSFITEKYAFEIGALLERWSRALKANDPSVLPALLHPSLQASSLDPVTISSLGAGAVVNSSKLEFSSQTTPGRELFLHAMQIWLGHLQVVTAEFDIVSIEVLTSAPLKVGLRVLYHLVESGKDGHRQERVGTWQTDWLRHAATSATATPAAARPGGGEPEPWKVCRWQAEQETVSVAKGPVVMDVTEQALGGTSSYRAQMLRGSDYWRSVLDGATGIDVYGNNGVAAGDFDNDGFDDLYVCQPAGLPNRLYRNRGDGTFDDVTDKAGVAVLDNTACALFADLRNIGMQDLLVVCGSGPLLFLNQGDGTFKVKPDAFQFNQPPQGTFTHAAIADYDRDGRLDIYFCLYSYYLGLDQYHYPAPYFDARNGPPNFLLHNQGEATFVDRTAAAGMQAENDRYSFACAWGESLANNAPDLYVANDFGRNNMYRNNGDGTFTAVSTKAQVEDVGAGMSACWADATNSGRQDVYVSNMWSAAGQRVSGQAQFHANAPEATRALYRRHAHGNALYRNHGDGSFANVSRQAGVEMGRWAWCSDFLDFDHDGYADLYVANGYITAPGSTNTGTTNTGTTNTGATNATTDRTSPDLGSFFWRQVVGKSPENATPSSAYEHGWNALNELIREDSSWSGNERNVLFANNRDGTFSEVSGAVGLDFLEDSRSFALADLDHDGRLEIVLKNRNAPQLRVLHNVVKDLGDSISFRLQGTKSNRDAIGAAITLEVGELHQTKYLQAGSGFLAQHSKEVLFGIGKPPGTSAHPLRASVRWPSGLIQQFESFPRNSRISLKEGEARFAAQPFLAVASQDQPSTAAPTPPEQLPPASDTWLIDPLKAPDFALPDLAGNLHSLQSLRGGFVLLCFWAAASPNAAQQLTALNRKRAAFAASHLSILAINVDEVEEVSTARSLALQQGLSFPVLFATQEIAGTYNIVYRYLFDRRRDLAIPSAFLLDPQGMIVKLYQGPLEPDQVLRDVRQNPGTPAERIRKALPFAGTLHQGAFQRNDFTYGVAMFQRGYLQPAEESFQQVVAAKPNDAEAHYNLGTLNLRRNSFAKARQYLQRSLELKPDYPEAWNNLGMMAAQDGNPDEAIQDFKRALLLRPSYAVALLNLGNVYRRQKDFVQAQQCLTRALEYQPDDPEANYSVGMFYAQQNQLQPASEYLEKAVALRPDYPEALNNLGVLYVREQNYPMAEAQFTTCIRLAPTFDQSYINLARLYVLQHDKGRAGQALQDLLRIAPDSASAKKALTMLNSTP